MEADESDAMVVIRRKGTNRIIGDEDIDSNIVVVVVVVVVVAVVVKVIDLIVNRGDRESHPICLLD